MARTVQQKRTTVRCRACDRESQHRFRTGGHFTCKFCGLTQPGPAYVKLLEQKEADRLNKLAAKRGTKAASKPASKPATVPATMPVETDETPKKPPAATRPPARKPGRPKKRAAVKRSPASKAPVATVDTPPPPADQLPQAEGFGARFKRILQGNY